jgi:hypothetical protein
VTVGAVYLPGIPSQPERQAPLPAPVAAADEDEAEEGTAPAPDGLPAPQVVRAEPTPEQLPRRTVEVAGALASDRRLVDAPPLVPPQRPAGERAIELAAAIDREIDRLLLAANVPASPLSSDAEFLRRVYLDLTGKIPPRERAVAFLDSTDPYKRAKLIDELLAGPEYGRHFAHLWTDLLVKRDFENNKNLKTDAFTAWLADQFNKNVPWDKIVTELLTATGREDQAPAVFFFLANQDNNQPAPEKLVGAAANLFMGIPLQCAQCHTHPSNGKWKQEDFWGLAAFFGHTRLERDTAGKKPTGPATLKEVDRAPAGNRANKNAKPLPVGATIRIPDPNDTKKTTSTAVAKYFEGDRPRLGDKAPYRPNLAAWLTSTQNKYFAPAAVNRLWHHFFARGIVNPIEEMGGEHQPTHPELLALLAAEFVGSGHDLKFLIRAVCNSNAYQRTSRPVMGNKDDERLFSHMAVKVLSARSLLESLAVATGRPINLGGGNQANKSNKNAAPGSLLRFFDTAEYDEDPTEFTYGIPQLLRLMNSNLSAGSTEAANRLVKAAGGSGPKAIEDIYLTVLSRRPSPTEAKRMADFVAQQGDKGYAGVFWALLNSAEFLSNH